MAPLVVEGDTLGQKHRNYNKLVKEAIKNDPNQQITSLNYDEPDLDNLYKIDIACNNRNVQYILQVLKCDDMLYVSRVIKQSTWLITDERYSSIINPENLFNSLSPQMTSKALNKLVLNIRLNLKDENRVEGFFNYFKKRDFQKALKWLPRCSIPFINNIIEEHADDIPERILKRLYEKSVNFLETFIRSYKSSYMIEMILLPAKFLFKKNVEKFIDIIESLENVYVIPHFGPKITKIVMEKFPERIMKNVEKYYYVIDIPTFAKYIRKEDAKNFILTHIKNANVRWWFVHANIKHFLNRLPTEERFDFVKKYFIEKYEDGNLTDETWDDIVNQCSQHFRGNLSSSKNIYSWYVYAPFDIAFGDLKQLIRNESNPSERISILSVMLICAGGDKKNVLKLLKYYREYHINEPFKFKIQFVNNLITNTDTHKYDKEAWGYLNDLFNSMEVYTKSDKDVQLCVKSVILHNVIKGENIPRIIQDKFEFENLSKIKLDMEEREKIFNFLYEYLIIKIKNDWKTDKEYNETVDNIVKLLNLLKDWNKELKDYPWIIQKITDLIVARKEHCWDHDLSAIYNIKISWRKLLLAESIILSPTQDSCINALKHSPQLLDIYREEINKLFIHKDMFFARFFKKLRIYWYQSLAECFKTSFLENIDEKSSNVALVKGLCTLFSRKEILDFIQKYVPTESKIDWSQSDQSELSLRKYIAKSMHLARPHPQLAVVLWYAKGDYLQFVLPSLNAVLDNVSATYIGKHLSDLLDTPVSLQQHGIRAAFSKLKHGELKNIFCDIWKSNKNSTIRTVIFCQTYNMLCNETDESIILEIWDLLSIFIEKLTDNENKKIYLTLSKVERVPLSVRPAFWVKSYDLLTKLPVTANCAPLINDLRSQMNEIIENLDIDFMAKIFFENFETKFTQQKYDFSHQVSLYLLSAKTETLQNDRYNKILLPILEKSISMWDKQYENVYYARCNLSDIFDFLSKEIGNVVLSKKYTLPIPMYTWALNKLRYSLPIIENYILLTNIKLSLGYIQILHDLKTKMDGDICSDSIKNVNLDQEDLNKDLLANAAPIYGKLCLNYLKEDVANNFPSIYIIFADVLNTVLDNYIKEYNRLIILKAFLDSNDFIYGHLLLLKLMPNYLYNEDSRALKLEILNEISSYPSEEVAMHYWLLRKNDE